jgi:hypothetical protein
MAGGKAMDARILLDLRQVRCLDGLPRRGGRRHVDRPRGLSPIFGGSSRQD